VQSVWQDIRYGARKLAKSPMFAAVVVLTLALGIGASTAIFSLVDAVVLRSVPVPNPEKLVLFKWRFNNLPDIKEYSSFGDCGGKEGGANPSGCSFPVSFFEELRSHADLFSGVAAFAGPADLRLGGDGPVSPVSGQIVSGDFFLTLGVNAIFGRTIGPADDYPSASPAVVLSYAFWQTKFGGDRSILGRNIQLNNVPFTIVGVAPPSFTSVTPGKSQDLWLPVAMLPRLSVSWGRNTESVGNWWLVVIGRLGPGVSMGRAEAAASMVFRNAVLRGAKALAKESDDPRIALTPAHEGLSGRRGHYSTQLYVLMAAVGIVLVISCVNIAGLLLSRAATRERETAMRRALGAGSGRIWRQVLTESMLLSISGGTLGILFAFWGVRTITSVIFANSHRPFPFVVVPDWRILLFTVGVSILTGVFFGLVPAFSSTRVNLASTLRQQSAALRTPNAIGTGRRARVGDILVVSQVALSFLALAGGGLLLRTLHNLRSTNPGFDPHNLLLFGVDPTVIGYNEAQVHRSYRELRERLAVVPGIISATYSSDALLSGGLWTSSVHIEGAPETSEVEVDMFAVGPDFLQTMGIPLLEGRVFTNADFEDLAEQKEINREDVQRLLPPIPVLVNQTFARQYLISEPAIGKRVTRGDREVSTGGIGVSHTRSREWLIIGVVGDTKYNSLRRDIHPTIYTPLMNGAGHFELRTRGDPTLVISAVRQVVGELDSNLPLLNVRTQTEQIDQLLSQERLIAHLASLLGLLTLLLACLGLYGLLSFEVTHRTHEIGIRVALGAEWGRVVWLVMRHGIVLTLLGTTVGAMTAFGATRYLASLLYGVKPLDPATFIAVATLLLGIALAACFVPARRATRVEPIVALRYE